MVNSHDRSETTTLAHGRERLAASATILGWLLLAGVIASQYVGHSSSPYGVCYAGSGRSVPCELAHHQR
jgi:hypothetical protein